MKRQAVKSVDDVEKELNNENKEDKRIEPKVLSPEMCDNGLYRVVFSAGGEVPDTLKGRWTSIAKVEAAISNHLALQA